MASKTFMGVLGNEPGSPKIHTVETTKRKKLTWMVTVAGLCFFFYIFGSWQSSSIDLPPDHFGDQKHVHVPCKLTVGLDFSAHHSSFPSDMGPNYTTFESCDIKFSEYTPCEDTERSLKYPREKLIYRERHCPEKGDFLKCLIPAPAGYKNPLPWPQSRDYTWFANTPHKELTVEKAIQKWVQFQGEKLYFPGGGTFSSGGADEYIDDIAALIPLNYGSIRTAIDTGCGVASWGAYLLKKNVLTMSFAPRDTHVSQIQFALERGVPAILGVMAENRMPYPARSFDMAHCSRCLIPWAEYDGLYLIEIDRVLRPGGFWILSGPPINWRTHYKGWQRSREDLKAEQARIEDAARRLCWKKYVEKENLAIWQKPVNHAECEQQRQRNPRVRPHICSKAENSDSAWYRKMETCISPLPEVKDRKEVAGGTLTKWPARLTAVPPRIACGSVPGMTSESYKDDTLLWAKRVTYYKSYLITPLASGRYRNIMDMSAGLGGFAAALVKDPVWVMNVMPSDAKYNTLGVIYERGLIGTFQNWCEAFSTYPRTYDLIHASGVFSLYQNRCDIEDILLEMDRILRPEGAVIIRDEVDVLSKVMMISNGMRWNTRMADHEDGPLVREKILIGVKTYWVGLDINKTGASA